MDSPFQKKFLSQLNAKKKTLILLIVLRTLYRLVQNPEKRSKLNRDLNVKMIKATASLLMLGTTGVINKLVCWRCTIITDNLQVKSESVL